MEKSKVEEFIDVSCEDDCLISSSSPTSGFLGSQKDHEYFELSELGLAGDPEGGMDFITEKDLEPMLCESSEPERTRKTGKCNLRKSLAWDSAFFTSAGVLEPEELSVINCGLNKVELHPLPGIEEDVRGSAESISTLESDNLTLENLEVGLFEDIRASIQRSSKASSSPSSSCQTGSRESGIQSFQSSRKIEVASRKMTKPIVASKRQTIITPGLERTNKENEKTRKVAEKTKREAERTKKEAVGIGKETVVRPRSVQAAPRNGELNTSSLRPPKIAGRVNPISTSPTKRTTLGANRVKVESYTVKAATGRRETLGGSKRSVLGDSCVTPRSTPSPKSSASSSASGSRMEAAASRSSHSRSGSTSSDSNDKSLPNSLKKKTTCRNPNGPSASTLKPPPRISTKNRTETGSSRLSAYLMSASNLSSSISPASSVDGRSSESSSSTSVNQHCNSSVSRLEIGSPCKRSYFERGASQTDPRKHQHDELRKLSGMSSPCSKKPVPGAVLLTRPEPTNVSRSSKPSGLRMPSPKLGFFDAQVSNMIKLQEKESTRSGSLQVRPGVQSITPENGAGNGSLREGTFKAKPGKLQPARNVAAKTSVKCDLDLAGVPHCGSTLRSTCPPQLHEFSNSSLKVSASKSPRVNCRSMTPEHQNDDNTVRASHIMTGEIGEVNNTDIKSFHAFPKEGENGGQGALLNDINTISEQLSTTKITSETFPEVSSELQNDMSCIAGT
ncbi:mediator of RNA polymerase II transcription subunit-like protein [Thalictrum thalictroides]|uniref:Mediator of RNA polymerase II transcription subunit-like protein n=1 Tax=Thalictrum thalictroides TaxID=46969 RepID=A0A7J6WHC4_THATH|nr:mediator of RNA polymerase II transcription subunit-like protein [Thalictrum thalictroides]